MAGSQDFATLGAKVELQGARQTEQELNRVSGAADRTARSFKKTEEATDDQSKANRTHARVTKDSTKAQDRWNDAMTRSSGRLKVIGRDINRYFILPMTAFVGLAARASYNLNEGLGNVQALIPDTGDRIYELRDSVRELGAETGQTFDDISSGLYRTISVFQDNAETVDRLNTAIRAGIAGYSTTAEAVQLLSSVTRSYGDTSAEAVDKVADLAFETIRLGDTTMPQLSGAMQVATDRAVRLGISQEELFATMSTLTGITGDASMVATQFRSAMDSILRPTDELTELIQKMGYETAEAAIAEESMVGLLVRIAREAERTGRPLQNYITRKEGVTLVSRLASEQLGDFAFRLGEIESSTGAATEAFENVTEGVAKWNFEIRKARERINGFLSEAGDNLLPTLSELFQIVGDIVEAFARLPDKVQQSTISMIGFATGLSILLQILGALKGLKVVALFGGIGRAVQQLSASAAILVKVVSALSVAGAVIAGVSAIIGVTYVRAQRKAEEAAERHQDRIDSLKASIDDLRNSAEMSERAMQALVLSQAQGFEDMGAVPTFRSSGRGDGSLERTDSMMYLANLTDEEEVQRQIQSYSEMLENLKKGFLQEQAAMQEELVESTVPLREGFLRRLESKEPDEYEEWVNQLFPSGEEGFREARETLKGDLAENFDEVVEVLTEFRDRYDNRSILGGPQAQSAAMLETLFETSLDRLIPEEQRLAEVRERIRNGEAIAADLEATMQVLSGVSFDPDGNQLMRWQEWMAQVTEVAEISFVEKGVEAARLFRENFQENFDMNQDIAEFLGADFDARSLVEETYGDIPSMINELLAKEGIDDPFALSDNAVEGMRDLFADLREEIALLDAQDMISEFADADKQMEIMRNSLGDLGMETENYEVTQSLLVNRLEDMNELMSDFQDRNISPQSEAFIALADAIDMTKQQLADLLDITDEVIENLTFREVLNDLTTVGDSIQKTFFEAFGGVSDEINDMNEKQLAAFEKTRDAAAQTAAVMWDITSAVVDGIGESVNALGLAIGEFGTMGDNFKTMMAEIWSSILSTIPPMLIQAGLMAMINGNWALGTMLLAMGIGGSFLSGYVEGQINKANTNAEEEVNGATQMNAKGGIINTPVSFSDSGERNVAGEAGWESIMPLTRNANGELGVKAQGGGGAEVNVSVHNYAGSDVEVEEQDDGSGNIEIILKKAMKGMVNSGALDKEFRGRYGLRSTRA